MSSLAINGIYENGHITLEEKFSTQKTFKVVVTFLEERESKSEIRLFSSFNFKKSQQLTAHLKTSLTDVLIEERRENP